MINQINISICIPAYKRPENIDRLLHTVSIQTFKNYEIVITDDSPDDSVQTVLQKYDYLPITYYKNEPALGTPANWNFAISKAKGEWIKLIHDDDWLASEDSLQLFAEATTKGHKFIFSAYNNVFSDTKKVQPMYFPPSWQQRIIHNPVTLLPRNVIGPPSVILVHRSLTQQYDTAMKWRVDIDFYIRLLKEQQSFYYINKPLVNVGISSTQVTNYCIDQPEVELPEGLFLLQKYGVQPLKNIRVYDAWWRIIRNTGIRSQEQLQHYTPFSQWPAAIWQMVQFQSNIPVALLKTGVCSKLLMAISFLLNFGRLNKYQ